MPVSGSSISRLPLVFALAGRVLPLLPLQPVLAASLYGIQKRHPQVFDRLGAHAAKRYGLDPIDLPFAFVLEPRRVNPTPKTTANRGGLNIFFQAPGNQNEGE